MIRPPTRIFIVDDHFLVREWLATLLRSQTDLQMVGQAADARSALDAIVESPPDVAVVDLSLKGDSGLDLIKDIVVRVPQVSVLVLSMYEELSYVERALRAGARGYVTKSGSAEQILEALRKVRDGHIFASPQMLANMAERMVNAPAADLGDPAKVLSDRELDVYRRLGKGQGTRDVANALGISIKTVQSYCQRIKDKLGFKKGVELAREAVRWVELTGQE